MIPLFCDESRCAGGILDYSRLWAWAANETSFALSRGMGQQIPPSRCTSRRNDKGVRHGCAGQIHLFSRKCWKPSLVMRFSSVSISGSGLVLKLKQAFPCMRFFSAGEIVLVSAGFM